jgi:hypothetical protein
MSDDLRVLVDGDEVPSWLGSDQTLWVNVALPKAKPTDWPGACTMEKQSLLDKVREWIGGIAFDVFLWAFRMTADEYRADILEDARREYESEKRTTWLMK